MKITTKKTPSNTLGFYLGNSRIGNYWPKTGKFTFNKKKGVERFNFTGDKAIADKVEKVADRFSNLLHILGSQPNSTITIDFITKLTKEFNNSFFTSIGFTPHPLRS